jgi:hypothetical protein
VDFLMENHVRCSGNCEKLFHQNCAGVKQTRSGQKTQNWKCNECNYQVINQRDTPTIEIESENTNLNLDILKEIRSINVKLADIASIKSDVQELKDSTQFLSDKFDKFQDEIKKIPAIQEELKQIRDENKTLKAQITSLNETVSQMEFDNTANQLTIENIPIKPDENLIVIINKIMDHVGMNIENNQIIEAKRLIVKGKAYVNPPSILVKFNSQEIRKQILAKRRTAPQILTKDVDPNGKNFGLTNSLTVYLNPCYPKKIRMLLGQARSIKKDTPFKIFYVYANKVWTKKNFPDEPMEIKDFNHIEEIKKAYLHG